MSIFDESLFGEDVGLGDLPAHAAPIERLETYRSRMASGAVPQASDLIREGVTHFTVEHNADGTLVFTFLDKEGQERGGFRGAPTKPAYQTGQRGPVTPSPGGGLLPPDAGAPQDRRRGPGWLPYALVGGGLLVAGGIMWAAMPKKGVTANRRRPRRTSR